MCLTVYFDGQFWVGVFEEQRGGELLARRLVFGAEPTDNEILELVRQAPGAVSGTLHGMPAADPVSQRAARANPKRLAREAARVLARHGISTKSQETLQRQREEAKNEARSVSRERREEARALRREAARAKALKRHRGH